MRDNDIIRLFLAGDRERAFTEIVKAYSERLFWYVRRYVSSHEDADDIVQDIFVKDWAALPSFRGESQLFTWLYRIATNEALNYVRRQKVRAALSFRPIDAEMERRVDEDPWFNGDEAERTLMKALQKLPLKQRVVFSMRYFEDMSYEEISEVTGTSVGALKASYHIASTKLKDELLKNSGQ